MFQRWLLLMVGLAALPTSSPAQQFAVHVGPASVVQGQFLSIAPTNTIQLSGTNLVVGSARLVIDGIDATFNPTNGIWSRTVNLTPGFNRLLIQALNTSNVPILSTNVDVVSELTSTFLGGTLGSNTLWNSTMGIIHVTNDVRVPSGGTLNISSGTVVLLNPGLSIRASNATLQVTGTPDASVYFLPANGTTPWGGVSGAGLVVDGTNGRLMMTYGETTAGNVDALNGASLLLQDSYFHDYVVSYPPIIHARGIDPAPLNPASVIMRRCHVSRYHEILLQITSNTLEDCLAEWQDYSGDGIDFDNGQPGSVIRNCTVRHGVVYNTDALDMGEASPTQLSDLVTIENCLLYDMIDKGVSCGKATNITIRHCLIHDVNSGVVSKDSSFMIAYNNTIISAKFGINLYEKIPGAGGGHAVTYNNILTGNATNVAIDGLSTVTVDYSDLHGSSWPGTGNISSDPLLVNEAMFDHRLRAGSPVVGTGQAFETMGCLTVPVGAAMAPSHPVISAVTNAGGNVVLQFYVDSDRTYTVQSLATVTSAWAKVVDVYPRPLPYQIAITNSAVSGSCMYRVVTPRQP